MSDTSRACGRYVRASPQLPVSWYFDPEIFALEKKLLFDAGANYVGHELMVPNVGDYHTLALDRPRQDAGAQRRAPASSSCPTSAATARRSCSRAAGNAAEHRLPAAPLDLRPEGRAARRAALPREPLRQAAFDAAHELERPALHRPARPAPDLARITTMADWDFSGYVLDSVRVDEYDINWKTFIETYLEVYHVDFFHPGLGNFTDCNNFSVDYGDEYSVQIVAAEGRRCSRPGTPVYSKWHEACLKQLDGREPKHGALWATYFPGLTFEWYPNVLIVSHLIPRSPTRTTNVVEFYYPEEIVAFRARIRRGAAGGVRRDRDRGQRDLRAPRPRPPRALRAGPGRRRPLPVTDGRRRSALPRVAAPQAGVGLRSRISLLVRDVADPFF